MRTKDLSTLQTIFCVIALAPGIWYFFCDGIEVLARQNTRAIDRNVAFQTVAQYHIAKRSGLARVACAQAAAASTSFLRANDEKDYEQWKNTERSDCKIAGIEMASN
ncbi:hypothetical protein [Collimonas fungivorans]|uniref:Uncharacterized protein n=1 Tax=Collimonas fungivorans (strain Ter331) TaxID=1005048 RepID=G0ACA5_COLFT|nr:hypothetical protein [Collimonas fungivorans]AEK62460.1 hypothetical protein CFU_2633 [Collimonas fungivorans Ter331]